jgi:hypothetical protein
MDMRTAKEPRVSQRPAPAGPARTRILLIVLLAAAAIAAGWWYFGRGLAVTVATAARGSAAEIVYATGPVEPERWARVATLVAGRIVERCNCEGEPVRTGDLLARLDDAEPRVALAGTLCARGLRAEGTGASAPADGAQHDFGAGSSSARKPNCGRSRA